MESPEKLAAIEQWTSDPCGSSEVEGAEQGTREYFKRLLAMRRDYAPWMAESLDYAGAHGLDVLDIGSGQGIDLAQYAIAGANAIGVELTPRHADLARLHLKGMELDARVVNGDAETLPFPDDSFDRASSNGVLHHTPDMPAALGEIRRVLRPDGEARIIVYNRSSIYYWVEQFLVLGVLKGVLFRERSMEAVLSQGVEFSSIGARPLVRVYSPRQTRKMLAEAGFRDVRTEVRHYNVGDTFLTRIPFRAIPGLKRVKRLNWIGRIAGWYVVAYGRK